MEDKLNINNQFVPYELALKFKEIEFDEGCLGTYSGEVLEIGLDIPSDDYFTRAPVWEQAFDWFRKQGLRFSIIDDHSDEEKPYSFTTDHEYYYDTGSGNDWFETYEEARQACLLKLIELCQ